jgi:hypothetical protein
MKTSMHRLIAGITLAAAIPVAVGAQTTMPQSTQDRQSIQILQYQLTQPGVNATDRRQIQDQISHLQYQINTRPLIETPHQNTTPQAGQAAANDTNQSFPSVDERANALVNIGDEPLYGVRDLCTANAGTLEYLNGVLENPNTTYQERTYIPHLVNRIQHQMRNLSCPAA